MRFIFFLIFFFILTNNYHSYANETHVVLKVNNKIITNIDIKKESRFLIALSPTLKSIEIDAALKVRFGNGLENKVDKKVKLKNGQKIAVCNCEKKWAGFSETFFVVIL